MIRKFGIAAVLAVLLVAAARAELLALASSHSSHSASSALVHSSGEFTLKLISRRAVDRHELLEFSGNHLGEVLSYSVVRPLNGLAAVDLLEYRELLEIYRADNELSSKYSLVVTEASEYLRVNSTWKALLREDYLNVTSFEVTVATNNDEEALKYNLTLFYLITLLGSASYDLEYAELNGTHSVRAELRNLRLNYSLLSDEAVLEALFIPGDLDLNSILKLGTRYLRAIGVVENSRLKVARYFVGLTTDIYRVDDKYVLKVGALDGASELVISYSDKVYVKSLSWRALLENGSLNVSVELRGRGYGASSRDRVLSILENARELSKEFGCIEVLASDFSFEVSGERTKRVLACSDTNLSAIDIHLGEGPLSLELSSFWLPLTTASIVASITVLVLSTISPARRARQ